MFVDVSVSEIAPVPELVAGVIPPTAARVQLNVTPPVELVGV